MPVTGLHTLVEGPGFASSNSQSVEEMERALSQQHGSGNLLVAEGGFGAFPVGYPGLKWRELGSSCEFAVVPGQVQDKLLPATEAETDPPAWVGGWR